MSKIMLWFCLVVLALLGLNGCATVPPYRPELAQPPEQGIYHIVGSGQTLYRISKVYCVDMKEIMRVNNIADPRQLGVGDRLFIPQAKYCLEVEPYREQNLESMVNIVGKKQSRIKWKTITLHHSATKEGNAEAFDRSHRRRKMGGLFYHFVIGNGTASGDGEVEVGWRWRRQIEVERKRDIQICLVGDFSREQVSARELKSLVELLKVLTKQYSIPLCNIRKHQDVVTKFTECPGDHFPFNKILAQLKDKK